MNSNECTLCRRTIPEAEQLYPGLAHPCRRCSLLMRAQVPVRIIRDGYSFNLDRDGQRAKIETFIADVASGMWGIIQGGNGSGKTTVSTIALWERIKTGRHNPRFISFEEEGHKYITGGFHKSDIFDGLIGKFDTEKRRLILIDDLGREPDGGDLFKRLIAHCDREEIQLIITTNATKKELNVAYTNYAVSRLYGGGGAGTSHLSLEASDYRKDKFRKQKEEK